MDNDSGLHDILEYPSHTWGHSIYDYAIDDYISVPFP